MQSCQSATTPRTLTLNLWLFCFIKRHLFYLMIPQIVCSNFAKKKFSLTTYLTLQFLSNVELQWLKIIPILNQAARNLEAVASRFVHAVIIFVR